MIFDRKLIKTLTNQFTEKFDEGWDSHSGPFFDRFTLALLSVSMSDENCMAEIFKDMADDWKEIIDKMYSIVLEKGDKVAFELITTYCYGYALKGFHEAMDNILEN